MSNDRNEPSDIQQQINHRTNESLESTRRMVGVVSEAQEIGVNTMVMLDEQDEKLDRIESGLDNVHANMYEAENNIDNLNKCCGLCILPWNRRRRRRPMSKSTTTYKSGKSSAISNEPKVSVNGQPGMPTGGYINRITNDDREVEMDDNLQIVGSYLGNLKNIALDMNDTLVAQNEKITRIGKKNDDGIERVSDANREAQKILRR